MNNNYVKITEIAKHYNQSEMLDKYNATVSAIKRDPIKKYAVLGEMNSGKSTLINALCGKEAVPVSILSNAHPSYVYIEQSGKDYGFAEIGVAEFSNNSNDPCSNPLWTVDSVVYVVSALNPLTSTDINIIKDCVGKSIPCTLVLNKLAMVDEEEREQTLSSVKSQMLSAFGDDHIIVFDPKNAADTVGVILDELRNSEDCRDYKEYALTIEFAKEMLQYLSDRHIVAQKRYDSLVESKSDNRMENLAWDEINVNLEKRKTQLLSKVDTSVYDMYSKCGAKLSEKMHRSQDPKLWWQKNLRSEMEVETEQIGIALNRMINEHIDDDKKYLVSTVKEKFDVNISVSDLNRNIKAYKAAPSNINSKLEGTDNNKKKAIGGFAASTIVMAGGLLLPLSTPVSIVTCGIAGVAMAGTGFWTYLEKQNSEEEKKRIIDRELDKYISQCRDNTMENIKGYIKYSYDNLLMSAKDAQLIRSSEQSKPSDDEKNALQELLMTSKDKDTISEILAAYEC